MDDFLQKLKTQVDILELVSGYVPLRRTGKNYVGLCPFHQEKTPSFTVSPENNIFYCFGCQAGGDALTFLMKVESITFPESVALLAEKLGLPLPERLGGGERKERKEFFWTLYEEATAFYERMLEAPEGKAARDYLARRGVDALTWRRFRLGFAPEGNRLATQLSAQAPLPQLVQLSLASERGGGSDLFRNRLIFPIMDLRGRPIAFGGRALDEQNQPKYLNSGATPLFEKGQSLYALHLARRTAAERRALVVVEGYMDAISAHQHGFTNTVASLGTSLTADQAHLLSRFTQRIYLAYDIDAAGINATLRALDLLRPQGIEVRVPSMAGYKDPDSLLRAQGAEAFSRALIDYLPGEEFIYRQIAQRHNWQVEEEKARAIREILAQLVARLPSALEKEKFLKRLALESGWGEEVLVNELNRLSATTPTRGGRRRGAVSLEDLRRAERTLPVLEVRLLHLILQQPTLLAESGLDSLRQDDSLREDSLPSELEALGSLKAPLEDFQNPICRSLLAACQEAFQGGSWPPTFSPEDPAAPLAARLLIEPLNVPDIHLEARLCLERLSLEKISRQLHRLKEEISILEKSGPSEPLLLKLQQYQALCRLKEKGAPTMDGRKRA
ncbi:MAG: DNA primase [Coprothermobacterota bacterium]|nr:DNA primase [Coprothermobacterota bacterium]